MPYLRTSVLFNKNKAGLKLIQRWVCASFLGTRSSKGFKMRALRLESWGLGSVPADVLHYYSWIKRWLKNRTVKRQTMWTDLTVTFNKGFIANYDEIIQTYKPATISEMTNHKILTQYGYSDPQLFHSFPPR